MLTYGKAFSGSVALLVLLPSPASPAPGGPASPPPAAVATGPERTIDARPWPRAYTVDGVTFSIYRPQVDSWTNNQLRARAVMAVRTGEQKAPSGDTAATQDYGVLWLTARTETDREAREVVLDDVTVDRISFPSARDQESRYLALARKVAPTNQPVASLNQIEASLALAEAGAVPGVSDPINTTPPEIIFSFQPALLVLIDGEPVFKPSGVAGVEKVINTRAMLLRHQGVLYITGAGGRWGTAKALNGPWTLSVKPPAAVTQAATRLTPAKPAGQQAQPAGAKPPGPPASPPQVIVRTHPAELIVVDGEPAFNEIKGTQLRYVSNTPADVLVAPSGAWYVLIAGRWFTAPSSKGPWGYVPPKALPGLFGKIPSDGPKGAVLASVPGTPEAQESLVANAVPQTATVSRKAAKFTARYDGPPEFRPITGTSLSYVYNSPDPVIRAGAAYYALQNGVWFMAASPAGPWAAATEVPAEIYKIPSASPLHYVTYVQIYGSNGDDIYVGYTPGYYGTVVNDGVVVYGSGYPCDSWIENEWYGCPTPYGYGAAFGYGAAYGWGLAFGWGWYDPWYDPWWGPWGYYPGGYWPGGYWPGGYWPGGAVAGNVYGRWGSSVVAGTAAAWANPWTGNYGRAGQGGYYNTVTGGRGYGYAGRNTNIYTGGSAAAAGGVRYNPTTGRVVAGQGGSISNIYTGEGVAGGSRTVVNTNTGRVTQQAGVAGRGSEGAGAARAFKSDGARVDAAGAGYIHYDRDTGDISKGGVVDINGNIYAGKDGQVYKRDANGEWSQAGAGGRFSKVERPDSTLDRERASRDRGFERDRAASRGFERSAASRPSFDRSSFGGGYGGRMGGMRGGGGRRR
ncbi:MAG: hypothetical protein V4466_02780 [Pseudomonadota bacterium]